MSWIKPTPLDGGRVRVLDRVVAEARHGDARQQAYESPRHHAPHDDRTMNDQIFETVVTTQSPEGVAHVAPMGVRYQGARVVLMPFKPSTTLANILATRHAVLNLITDTRGRILESNPAAALLAWYDRHRRHLPWRMPPGEPSDPYRVWVSEVMLQQTTAAAAGPRFRRFLERFPDVHALAAAPDAGAGARRRRRGRHAAASGAVRLAFRPESLPAVAARVRTSDLLLVLGKNHNTEKTDLERILTAISTKLVNSTHSVYIHGEDDRLASAVTAIFGRDLLAPKARQASSPQRRRN